MYPQKIYNQLNNFFFNHPTFLLIASIAASLNLLVLLVGSLISIVNGQNYLWLYLENIVFLSVLVGILIKTNCFNWNNFQAKFAAIYWVGTVFIFLIKTTLMISIFLIVFYLNLTDISQANVRILSQGILGIPLDIWFLFICWKALTQ